MLALLLLLEKGLALLFLLLLDACELVVLLEVFFGEVADVALTLFKIVDSRLLRRARYSSLPLSLASVLGLMPPIRFCQWLRLLLMY